MTVSAPSQLLFERLEPYHADRFSGRLTLKAAGSSWKLYLKLGSLTWATGGVHPVRRLRRQLLQACDACPLPEPAVLADDTPECWDYNVLNHLNQQQQLGENQMRAIVRGTLSEVLFDLIRAIATEAEAPAIVAQAGVRPTDGGLLLPSWDWPLAAAQERAIDLWQQWSAANLTEFPPDCALWICQPEDLKVRTSANLYAHLEDLADGQHTLRDLATRTGEGLVALTRLLAPYLRRNAIELLDVLDISLDRTEASNLATAGIAADLGHSLQILNDFPRNAMEQLVITEVKRQLRQLPPEATIDIKFLDAVTYALNRLPPLYASTPRGLRIQVSRGKRELGDRLKDTVRAAILALYNKPRGTNPAASASEDTAIAEASGTFGIPSVPPPPPGTAS